MAAEHGNGSAREKKPWTVMIYMVADTGEQFYRAALEDIVEMRKATKASREKNPGKAFNVLVHVDPPAPWEPKRWEVTGGELLPPCTAGDKGLLNFVKMCILNYPANNYLLVLWGHGEGIDWKEKALAYTQVPGTGKGFGVGSGGFMKIAELRRAIEQLKQELKSETKQEIKAENFVLGFDSCLMAMVEVYFELREHVGWIVAGNDEIPDTGWPYDKILSAMAERRHPEPLRLVELIIEKCRDSYSDKHEDNRVSFSGCHLRADTCETLATRVRELASALKEPGPEARKAIKDARTFAEDLQEKAYVDLEAFCYTLREHEHSPHRAREAAQRVSDALKEFAAAKPGFSAMYPSMYMEHSGAVSICFPETEDAEASVPGYEIDWTPYENLDFTRDTKWIEFLKSYWPSKSPAR